MQAKRAFARRSTAAVGGVFAAVLLLAGCGGSNDAPDGAVETTEGEDTSSDTFNLVKEDDEWRICDLGF